MIMKSPLDHVLELRSKVVARGVVDKSSVDMVVVATILWDLTQVADTIRQKIQTVSEHVQKLEKID